MFEEKIFFNFFKNLNKNYILNLKTKQKFKFFFDLKYIKNNFKF